MIREGTRGAEGKNKGIERKEFERAKRRKRQKTKSLRSQARWAKYKKIKPCPRRVHEEIRSQKCVGNPISTDTSRNHLQ